MESMYVLADAFDARPHPLVHGIHAMNITTHAHNVFHKIEQPRAAAYVPEQATKPELLSRYAKVNKGSICRTEQNFVGARSTLARAVSPPLAH